MQGLLSIHQRVGADGVSKAARAPFHFIHQERQIVELALKIYNMHLRTNICKSVFFFVYINIVIRTASLLPGGQGSGFPAGVAEWWLQNSEPPAHGSAALRRRCRASPQSSVEC